VGGASLAAAACPSMFQPCNAWTLRVCGCCKALCHKALPAAACSNREALPVNVPRSPVLLSDNLESIASDWLLSAGCRADSQRAGLAAVAEATAAATGATTGTGTPAGAAAAATAAARGAATAARVARGALATRPAGVGTN